MFDGRWLGVLVAIAVVGAITRSPALIGLALLSATLILLSHWLRRHALEGVTYRRRFSESRLFLGESVMLTCTVANHGRLPLISLQVKDGAPRGFYPEGSEDSAASGAADAAAGGSVDSARYTTASGRVTFTHLMALLPGEQASRHIRLKPGRRGYYVFESAELTAADLLGLFEVVQLDRRPGGARDSLIVYPRVFDLEQLGIATREPYGAMQMLRGLIEEPSRIVGARDYRYGDSFRQIHWKATAHHGHLQTRVCEYTSDPTAVIFLNVATSQLVWQSADPEVFEWAVAVAASIATWAHNSGAVVGLKANGNAPGAPKASYIRPQRSAHQLARILEALALVGPHTFFPFEEYLAGQQQDVPFGATQIVVTPIFTPEIEIAFRQLHDAGKRVALVCVGRESPDVGSLPFPAYHVPPSPAMPVFEDAPLDNLGRVGGRL